MPTFCTAYAILRIAAAHRVGYNYGTYLTWSWP